MIVLERCELPDELRPGMDALKTCGFAEEKPGGLAVTAIRGAKTVVEKSGNRVTVTYDTLPHFFMALARGVGLGDGRTEITPKIKELGLMLDCSRNAVATPRTLRQLICVLSLAGYTYLELYTEDTYKLPGEPYFGYGRCGYTRAELEETVAFCERFGMVLVPCIQTLAHLERLYRWKPYSDFTDVGGMLLANDERSYELIRKCVRYCHDVFHTKRINIGTDEAHLLGRGKYLDRYGYRDKDDIYVDHLRRVFAICKEEGMCPEFWGDAFYHTKCSDDTVRALFDGEQTPIYWDYYNLSPEYHRTHLETLKRYAGKVIYAGGLWKWCGYAPNNRFADLVHESAFPEALQCGVEDIFVTAWGDNGDECSIYAVLPAMWHAAELLYPCGADVGVILQTLTGYTEAEWRTCDLPNRPLPGGDAVSSAAKNFLHNDFLVGLMDCSVPDTARATYTELARTFAGLTRRESPFAYVFRLYETLCRVLIEKTDYSKRLYTAYHANDRSTIRALADELPEIQTNLRAFYDAMRDLWLRENKGMGLEILDARIGGLIERADTVARMLDDYLAGKAEKIYELEDERLDVFCGSVKGDDFYRPWYNSWGGSYSTSSF